MPFWSGLRMQHAGGRAHGTRTVMNSIESESCVKSSLEFRRLRFYVNLSIISAALTGMIADFSALFSGLKNHALYPVFVFLCYSAILISVITCSILERKLRNFICPQCGNRFNKTRFNHIIGTSCQHCGFNLYEKQFKNRGIQAWVSELDRLSPFFLCRWPLWLISSEALSKAKLRLSTLRTN